MTPCKGCIFPRECARSPNPNAIQIKECSLPEALCLNNQSSFSCNTESYECNAAWADWRSGCTVMAAAHFTVASSPVIFPQLFSISVCVFVLVNFWFFSLIFFQYDRLNLIKVSNSSLFSPCWLVPSLPAPVPPVPLVLPDQSNYLESVEIIRVEFFWPHKIYWEFIKREEKKEIKHRHLFTIICLWGYRWLTFHK